MKTLTLPESEIITLASAAKKYGTVELAKAIGIGKSQLYRILRGHNRVTPETADKISIWLNADSSDKGRTDCRLARSEVSENSNGAALQGGAGGQTQGREHHRGGCEKMWRLTYYMAGIVSGMLGGAALIIVIHG